jgi:hypothetical protein
MTQSLKLLQKLRDHAAQLRKIADEVDMTIAKIEGIEAGGSDEETMNAELASTVDQIARDRPGSP